MINGQNTTKKINGGVAFVLAFAIFNFVGIICSLIVSAVGLEKSTLYYVISGLVSSVSFLIVILYFSYANRVNPLRISNVNKCSWIYFLLAIIIAIGMFFGFGFANGLLIGWLESLGLNFPKDEPRVATLTQLIVYGVIFAILPAILEESFFRGVMLNGIKGKPIFVTLSISICFALYHGSLAQFIYQFVFGFMLTLLAVKAKSALPSIVAHFTNNLGILILDYLKIEVNLLDLRMIISGMVLIISVAVLLLCKSSVKTDQQDSRLGGENIKNFWLPFGLLGVLFCAFVVIVSLF